MYEIMHKRQCGEDSLRNFVTLIWDEYIANILALLGTEKKKAEAVMHKVSEILMLGRSLAVRLVIACQRPDASAFLRVRDSIWRDHHSRCDLREYILYAYAKRVDR